MSKNVFMRRMKYFLSTLIFGVLLHHEAQSAQAVVRPVGSVFTTIARARFAVGTSLQHVGLWCMPMLSAASRFVDSLGSVGPLFIWGVSLGSALLYRRIKLRQLERSHIEGFECREILNAGRNAFVVRDAAALEQLHNNNQNAIQLLENTLHQSVANNEQQAPNLSAAQRAERLAGLRNQIFALTQRKQQDDAIAQRLSNIQNHRNQHKIQIAKDTIKVGLLTGLFMCGAKTTQDYLMGCTRGEIISALISGSLMSTVAGFGLVAALYPHETTNIISGSWGVFWGTFFRFAAHYQ